MSSAWSPPRRAYHLRVFGVSLGLIAAGLAAFLFGVRMEAVEPATGIITARDLEEVRSTLEGLIEPGWYEGEIEEGGHKVRVPVDSQGPALTHPAAPPPPPAP